MESTTKIVGQLSEFKEEKVQTKGLLQRIESAKTVQDIEYLLEVGKKYTKVSVGTMRKWVKAAEKRKKIVS